MIYFANRQTLYDAMKQKDREGHYLYPNISELALEEDRPTEIRELERETESLENP